MCDQNDTLENNDRRSPATHVLQDILVPSALLRAPESFGGTETSDCRRADLEICEDGTLRLTAAPPGEAPRVLVPAPIEAHCHLDKCHSISRLAAVGGDLDAAIAAQAGDKRRWTEADLRQRMTRGIDELIAAGCCVSRRHIDWTETSSPPLAWHVLNKLADECDALEIHAAALTDIDQMADDAFCITVARETARMRGALGSFLLFHKPETARSGLTHMFAAAEQVSLALDFRVDDGSGHWNNLELICDIASATCFQGPILFGHAVSRMDRSATELDRIIEKLLRANIHICALPTTNLYLQGRTTGTPDRGDVTRLRELHAAGVRIVVASDNVADAFCPTGLHDPQAGLHLASLAAHLDPPMAQWLPTITTNAATATDRPRRYVEDTPPRDLRLCAASTTANLIAGRAPLLPLTFERTPA